MDYVGIDPAVGLECAECKKITRLPYSALLDRVVKGEVVDCVNCERGMSHDWTTVNVVQNIIKKRLNQANEARTRDHKQQQLRDGVGP